MTALVLVLFVLKVTAYEGSKMRIMTAVLMLLATIPASAQKPLPVVDMHLHASAADDNGPPPLGLCVPLLDYVDLVRDPARPWGEIFMEWQKKPPCPDPVWSPRTDDALERETIAVMERRNVIGVLSGPSERVQQWRKAAPDRFIPSLQFQFGREELSPDSLRRLHAEGRFAVFAEVSNQYVGITASDPRFEPYLAVAEELDVPVGIHVGTGPPGAPHSDSRSIEQPCTALSRWRTRSFGTRNCASTSTACRVADAR